jgi:curved DNA-binding protein CbpA
MLFTDYYHILEINRDATPEEIKQAYRRLAKKYHPDKNPGREKSVERKFRQIAVAYETLSDTKQKFKYDLMLQAADRKERLRARYFDQLSRAEQLRRKCALMFHEFLNRNIEAGVSIYEQLQREDKKFRLDDVFDYDDSRDCEFLIAEAYHKLGDHRAAMGIYESLIEYEKRRPCFHHFTDEIKERLKQIYFHVLTNPENLEAIPTDLEKIRALDLSKQETAWIYKRLAECYIEINWMPQAKELLTMAFELNPRIKGAKKLCEQLGMEHLLRQRRKTA